MNKTSLIVVFVLLAFFLGIASIYISFIQNSRSALQATTIPAFDRTKEASYVDYCNAVKEAVTHPDNTPFSPERNIFTEKKEEKHIPLFVVRNIRQDVVPVVFKGSIVRGDDVIIAQINLNNKTYFVRNGETVENWRFSQITKEYVSAIGPEGNALQLRLNTPAYSEQRTASIFVSKENKVYQARKNDTIAGYKVLDIKNDHVILSYNNSQIRISPEN